MTTTTEAATLEHQLGSHGRFALRMPSGTASVQAVDGELARVRDLTGRSIAERFQVTAEQGVLELVLKSKFGLSLQIGSLALGSDGMSPDLVIELPRATRVAIDTASADVSVTGIAAPGRFRTTSGDLIVQDFGGDIEIEDVSGDLRIEAVVPIELSARTISGDATVRAPRLTRLDLATTSGDLKIDAELSGKGPYAIKSISGDVTIVSRGSVQVEAQTVTGDLRTDLDHRSSSGPGRKTLSVGRGGPTLTYKSVSGDLRVVEPRDAPPAVSAATTPTGDATGQATGDASDGDSEPMPEFAAPARTAADAARLDILKALERGEIDVETATTRLAAVEGA